MKRSKDKHIPLKEDVTNFFSKHVGNELDVIGFKDTQYENDKVIVFQVVDDPAKYETWTNTVVKCSEKFNFNYELEILNREKWTNQFKPKILLQKVEEEMKKNNGALWIIFRDADICVKNFEFNMKSFLIRNKNYDFMFQDSGHTVNSGFLIIKNTEYSKNILKNWIGNQKLRTCPCSGDQMYLQITMLQYAYRFRNTKYDDECCFFDGNTHDANLCYKRHMNNLNFPVNFRKFEKILMIDNKTRFNMHDSGDYYQKGDVFYHCHKEKMCLPDRNYYTFLNSL